MKKQHHQLPNGMEVDPKDQLIYLVIKSYETKIGCFPSLRSIADKSGASVPTVRDSIKRLTEMGYISIVKNGRRNEYVFNDYKKFEPFSPEFINNKDISFLTKAYIVASQQYMFKDVEGVGKLSLSNHTLADKIHMPESTIRKCNKELERKHYLTIVKNGSRDIESGCFTDTKVFNMQSLGQAIIWVLKNHEDRITENESQINELKETVAKQQELINKLLATYKNDTNEKRWIL